jgi:hypothetical protein
MSTLAEGVPAGTGRPAASVSSARHRSVAKLITVPPGSLAPVRPSVDAKELTTGTPKAAVMAARLASVSISLVVPTDRGAICSRPARCSAASCASLAGYPTSTAGCRALSWPTASASGRLTGTGTIRTGPQPRAAARNRVECTGAAAAFSARTAPSGDCPAASIPAIG